MKFKQGLALLSSLFVANSLAATSRWSGDWFEIEVILLSNIADKSAIKEVFSNQQPLPDYEQSRDLLGRYLAPDVNNLKRLLPQCYTNTNEQEVFSQFFTVTAPKLNSLTQTFNLSLNQHLVDLDQRALAEERLYNEQQATDTQTVTSHDEQTSQSSDVRTTDDFYDRVKTTQEGALRTPSVETAANNRSVDETMSTESLINTQETLSSEDLTLLETVEKLTTSYPDINFYLPDILDSEPCTLTPNQFDALSVDPALYSYSSYAVDHVPSKVDGLENLYSSTPYLISSASLKLDDIVLQLKRSRDFKPLLHVGWRQQVFEQRKSVPMRLYAGANLQKHYQQALIQYNQERQAELDSEQSLQSVLGGTLNNTTLSPALQKQQAITQRKQQLLSTLEHFNQEQPISQLTLAPEPITYGEQLSVGQAPTPPIQPWYLNGFLNVYLIGNYLNVKADFSIMNLSLAERASLALRPNATFELTPVKLEQKRRVISQETHYFDHPYMGMIVQIRRHDRPESGLAQSLARD
ncbi:CsiV family protein [Thalassotalea sp. 1_MG-2023]|uniref:CsiV family protein n=1 Tax=Thalassotalea sp. 1_MG-2023 TaxID=3062680 RepID=UPI0026E384DD|nr:CsiV family protein [Thalassotalea sp. 1_MG-2023]MDO6428760.1 CsiV family protein [Thalassotalea sp. 1_MG-2023]